MSFHVFFIPFSFLELSQLNFDTLCISDTDKLFLSFFFSIFFFKLTFFFFWVLFALVDLIFLTTFQQNFLNNFQTAQDALNAVTVQAAEMAASSMKDFAKKSFRLLMDINLKAPVIVIPESSTSCNALIADLGLIRVQNEFKLVSSDESSLPPVIDNMDVQLTHLKLSRYTKGCFLPSEILY